MKKTTNQNQIIKGKWRTYHRTPRRFKVCVDSLTFSVYDWCNEDKLSDTIQKFYDKYEICGFTEIHVYEILEIDWEEEEA